MAKSRDQNKDLDLLEVEVHPARPKGPPNFETGEVPRWIDVSLSLRNNTDKDIFVMSTARQIHYDAAQHLLTLGLHEPTPDPDRRIFHASMVKLPDFVPIRPHESGKITVSVPEVINFINPIATSEKGPSVTSVDISGVQHVELTIAYADKPFEAKPGTSPDELRRQLATWGRTIEHRVTPRKIKPDSPQKTE
ncbi:MAG TPA: hypothetical protein VJS37_16535 [Terriglobales bacterium]|nr:hypothetical protein [Terriglobales bacterium]